MPVRPSFDASINYYEILDVPYTATKSEITRAYRGLMRHAHPDRVAGEQAKRKAEERAKLLNAAYQVLSRPEQRREYDKLIRQRAVNDALFQRYTGNAPAQRALAYQRRTASPGMERERRRATSAAFAHLLLYAAIFAVAIMVVLVVVSAGGSALHGLGL
ncbi:MAG TPA: J domain-containing protein [Thermomicrobiaceae bacterium]|nr:J domain-containing protein [Thermomicrobiaceae bacterium]